MDVVFTPGEQHVLKQIFLDKKYNKNVRVVQEHRNELHYVYLITDQDELIATIIRNAECTG